ncbi:histidine kinase [Thalassotalea sp. 42_200_T64]|nr:histidine kinase [Thalassotalea sp. 42_200_T64]
MAGIGFEIRKILKKDSLSSIFEAYAYAGLIGSGPWVLSILALLVIGFISLGNVQPDIQITQFLVMVTYLVGISLVLTGGMQLMFTRFVSDQMFIKQDDEIFPNLITLLILFNLVVAVLSFFGFFWFEELMVSTRIVVVGCLILLCNLWLLVVFLSGMKRYKLIVGVMFIGYSAMVLLSMALNSFGLLGLFISFFIGNLFLVAAFLFAVVREHSSDRFISFNSFNPKKSFWSLFVTGTCFNLAVWIDKVIFWFSPETSESIVGPLRVSIIYDFPIFLAYLSIIPGMAVFMVRMETDFAEAYENFYDAIRNQASLQEMFQLKGEMVLVAKQGIYEIFKIQGITMVALLIWGKNLLMWLGIDGHYAQLLYILLPGVALQVLLMSLLNILFYLDKRTTALLLAVVLLITNAVFSSLSVWAGPYFYGYGYTASMLVTSLFGLYLLKFQFDDLEYNTFMLQGKN